MSEEFNHSKGIITFVFGLLSVVMCGCGWIFGPIGLFMGKGYLEECIVAGVEPEGLGKIGRILAMVGTVLGVLYLLFIILYVVCFGGLAVMAG